MVDLREKRMEKSLTQEQLAEKVYVGRTTISNIECGFALPSVETAKLIGAALGFDWTQFLKQVEQKHKNF